MLTNAIWTLLILHFPCGRLHPANSKRLVRTLLATSATAPTLPGSSSPVHQLTSEPETRLETVTKNYVVHELAQHKNAPKPSWTDTMESMFGSHVKWDEVKVFVGRIDPYVRVFSKKIID